MIFLLKKLADFEGCQPFIFGGCFRDFLDFPEDFTKRHGKRFKSALIFFWSPDLIFVGFIKGLLTIGFPLLRPYFFRGGWGWPGVSPLDCHDDSLALLGFFIREKKEIHPMDRYTKNIPMHWKIYHYLPTHSEKL